ncbi:unnamed protein product [Didymodactylos carnosus]|uniref:Uncharacterized protein n=1 Tax=Didymodactylos carnosus TaxID=1234261 RepID=A0A814D2Z8_9BILA|nr:unnamed protein product [Didymodactylos carnosus]CAF3724526.1 unnamed protein product [Didymodactylos carnosus]
MFSLNPSSSTGTTAVFNVADPSKIYIDDESDGPTIYIAIFIGNRVEKWKIGSSSGVQLGVECRSCLGISVDKQKNVYMSESDRHRILKWSPETNDTIVVAGRTDERGGTGEYLSSPAGIYVDRTSGALYVADSQNNRIQKWVKNAQTGITVAGSNADSPASDAASLTDPSGVLVDEETNIVYVVDSLNNRIQRWLFNASKGDTIAGGFGMHIFHRVRKRELKLTLQN